MRTELHHCEITDRINTIDRIRRCLWCLSATVVLLGILCLIRAFCQFAAQLNVTGWELILVAVSNCHSNLCRDVVAPVGVFAMALLPYLLLALICETSIFGRRRYGRMISSSRLHQLGEWALIIPWGLFVLKFMAIYQVHCMMREILLKYGSYPDANSFVYLMAEATGRAVPFGVFCCVWAVAAVTIDWLLLARQRHLGGVPSRDR